MIFGGERPLAQPHVFTVPADRQLVGDLGQDFVAARIAPEDKIMGSDIGVGESAIVLNPRLTTKLLAPVRDSVSHLRRNPGANLVVKWLASRPDHQKTIQEGVVDRTLQSGPFAQLAIFDLRNHLPGVVFLAEMRRP